MKVINLTPKHIKLVRADGSRIDVLPGKRISKVTVQIVNVGEVDGVPVIRKERTITWLPEPKPDTIYIVGIEVLALTSRPDVYGVDNLDMDTPWDEGWEGTLCGSLRQA